MFEIQLDNAVATIVETMLPRFSGEKGLAVKIRTSVSCFSKDGEDDRRESREIQMVFHREYNYTSVFVALRESAGEPLTPWALTSHHDSCWRTDGFRPLTELYFAMCKKVAPEKAPVSLSQFVTIDKIEIIDKLEVERGPDDCGPGRYKLTFKGI